MFSPVVLSFGVPSREQARGATEGKRLQANGLRSEHAIGQAAWLTKTPTKPSLI